MTADSTNTSAVSSINPQMHEGELRILDTELAVRLGFERPRKIRDLIKRWEAEISRLGVCPTVEQTPGPQGGRPTAAYYLNRKQAIFITGKSDTPEATTITIEIIEKFDAYERGAAPAHPAVPTSFREALLLAAEQQETIEAQAKALTVAQPKADALDELAGLEGKHNIRWSAAECQMKEKDFTEALIRIGWCYRQTTTGRLTVYAAARDAGYMTVKNVQIQHRSGEREGIGQPMLTQRGLAKIMNKLAAERGKRFATAPFVRAPEAVS